MLRLETSKTLEQLENDPWKEPQDSTPLILKCFSLRKKPIQDFRIEDFRIMIGQQIGLPYLVPAAVSELEKNILAEGDFYEGDLLTSILNVSEEFWLDNPELKKRLNELISINRPLLINALPKLNIDILS